MSDEKNKDASEVDKKEGKKDVLLGGSSKTETTYFFLSTFDSSKDDACEVKLPKNFREFDCLLRKILLNLEETENVFLNQAKAVLDRDLTLINWRFRLKNIHDMLNNSKNNFERIDQVVRCIFQMSSHIEDILTKLEKELPGPSLIQNAFKYSPTRMSMYDSMMRNSITQRIMLQQLSSAVCSINEAIECNPSDPVEQFTRILSLHTEVLKTIEFRSKALEEQLEMVENLRKSYASSEKLIPYHFYCLF